MLLEIDPARVDLECIIESYLIWNPEDVSVNVLIITNVLLFGAFGHFILRTNSPLSGSGDNRAESTSRISFFMSKFERYRKFTI